MSYIKVLFLLWKFMRAEYYKKAVAAVREVSQDQSLRSLGQKEGYTSFCPRCGQRPTHDVRHDDAFERAFGNLDPPQRVGDMHFAIELAHWLS